MNADIEDANRPGMTKDESAELREAKKRIRLLEQKSEVMRRAIAYLSRDANPNDVHAGRDLAGDGIPVTAACRVVGFSTQTFYKWSHIVTATETLEKAPLLQLAHIFAGSFTPENGTLA